MKITLKNARKTLRFVTVKKHFFSFRAVGVFFLFFFFIIFIYLSIYFYFFSQWGVNDYFHFFYFYPKIVCMLQVNCFSG